MTESLSSSPRRATLVVILAIGFAVVAALGVFVIVRATTGGRSPESSVEMLAGGLRDRDIDRVSAVAHPDTAKKSTVDGWMAEFGGFDMIRLTIHNTDSSGAKYAELSGTQNGEALALVVWLSRTRNRWFVTSIEPYR